MTEWVVYTDLDGVLADFDKKFEEFGHGDPDTFMEEHGDVAFWAVIKKHDPRFYLHLDIMSDGKELWNYIKQFNPIILTRIPRMEHSSEDKKTWVKKHLGDVKVITTTKKEKYVEPDAILIDDMDENIEKWEKAGGIGILHTSASKTIKELKRIMKEKEASERYLFAGIHTIDDLLTR